MHNRQLRAIGFGVAVHLARFAIIWVTLALAPLVGITGWYLGLAANVTCVIFAATLVSVRGLWKQAGILVAWRGPTALVVLIPLVGEILLWSLPAGLSEQPPGYGLWTLTLLLAAANEELTSRVVVLERMRPEFGPHAAVAITATLFGLQHLSAFATTTRTAEDILLNVVVSACYGCALAAFQLRFRWIWPLMLMHASANFVTLFLARPLPDAVIAVTAVVFVALGLCILRISAPEITPAASRRSAPPQP